MILLIGILTIVNVLFYTILALSWKRVSFTAGKNEENTFSVIIPVRNEEDNISEILEDLEKQDFPNGRFEVIVVDDFSEDETIGEAQKVSGSSKMDLRIIDSKEGHFGGKKHALTRGIEEAKFEIILTTDADCRIGAKWIKAYASAFQNGAHIVTGPVALQGDGIFAGMQKTEFAGLMAFGGVTLSYNNPSMCSGANLGFRKKSFEQVGGYSSNIEIPSGDDEFLLYSIVKESPNSGLFLKSEEAIVKTKAQSSLHSFFHQRARWVSKWKHNRNWKLRLMAIVFFTDYALFLSAGIAALAGLFSPLLFGALFGFRLLANYAFLKPSSNFLGHRKPELAFLLLQIFYPLHVLFMGAISIFGSYTWKGRKYHG